MASFAVGSHMLASKGVSFGGRFLYSRWVFGAFLEKRAKELQITDDILKTMAAKVGIGIPFPKRARKPLWGLRSRLGFL